MRPDRSERIRAALAGDPELAGLVADDEGFQAALDRAALVRTFDRALYDDVLCDGVPAAPTFDAFVARPEVEAVAYSEGRHWVRDTIRVQALRTWRESRPDEQRTWAARILAHERARGTGALDVLELLLRVEPGLARAEFRRLYLEADRQSDLTRCHALLELLDASETDLQGTPDIVALRQEYSALYRSRALYSREFRRTARYVRRPHAQRRLRRSLRAASRGWIVNLYGPGGSGKTTMLQWLVARRCVRRRFRIPCVRIDFDTISLTAACDHPWLLAIPIVEQLDRQLPQTVFGTMALSLAPFRPLLYGDDRLSAEELEALRARAAQTDFWPSLVSGCGVLPQDRPTLIVVDTLEEATVHRPRDVVAIVRRLAELHASAPRLRVVLSGRYAIGVDDPAYCDEFGKATRYLRVRWLSRRSARTFVRQLWPDAGADLVDAVVERGSGNPFRLSLLVELASRMPEISQERILGPEFDHVDEAYLIERVIRRIPVRGGESATAEEAALDQLPVRWVVRYGVVPRRLTQPFVADVLLPFLVRAIAGDAAAAGDDLIEEARRGEWFPRPGTTFDGDRVWRDLTAYATGAEHGWISVENTEPPAARFHPDIVTPMRRLLRGQRVFAQLHREAEAYFRARGSVVDVLFHRLQLDPDGAEGAWAAAFAAPDLRADAAARRRLAESLLSRDFADAPPRAQAVAHFEMARAIADAVNHTLILPALQFDEAWRHLARAIEVGSAGGPPIVGPGWEASLAAARAWREGRLDECAAPIERALADPRSSQSDRVRLLLHHAEILVRTGQPAVPVFEAALAEAVQDPDAAIPPAAVHRRLGYRLMRQGDWARAAEHYGNMLDAARRRGDAHEAQIALRALVEANLSMGRPATAFELLRETDQGLAGEPAGGHGSRRGAEPAFLDLHARVALALMRTDYVGRHPWFLGGAIPGLSNLAEASFLRGSAHAARLDVERASREFERGRRESSGAVVAKDLCRLGLLRLFVEELGLLDEARNVILGGPLQTAPQEPALLQVWAPLAAYVADAEGAFDDARRRLEELRRLNVPDLAPQRRIVAEVASISLGLESLTQSRLDLLLGDLEQVRPESARFQLLDSLALGRRWEVDAGVDVASLLAAFEDPGDPVRNRLPLRARERLVHALARAELLRALGLPGPAVALLQAAGPPEASPPSTVDDLLPLRRRLAVESRLRRDGAPVPVTVPDWTESLPRLESHLPPLFVAVLLTELAEAELADGDRARARRYADRACETLDRQEMPTIWHARARAVRAHWTSDEDVRAAAETLARLGYTLDYKRVAVQESNDHVIVGGVSLPKRRRPTTPDLMAGSAPSAGQSHGWWRLFWPKERSSEQEHSEEAHRSADDAGVPVVVRRVASGGCTIGVAGEAVESVPQQLVEALRDEVSLRGTAYRIGTDWRRYADVLGAFLDRAAGLRERRRRARVLLDLPHDLQALPWELVSTHPSPGGEPPVPLRIHVSSGRPGGSRHAGRCRVLLLSLRRPQGLETAAMSVYGQLPHVIRQSGCELVEGDFPFGTGGEKVGSPLAVDVIYLVAPLDDTDPTVPLIVAGPTALDPRELDTLLRRNLVAGSRPTVILDAPAPGSPVEAAQQLLLRNRFAFDLFSRGGVHAVMATGLGDERAQLRLVIKLAERLAAQAPAAEALDAIRRAAEHEDLTGTLHRVLPFAGTAAFVGDARAPLVAGAT